MVYRARPAVFVCAVVREADKSDCGVCRPPSPALRIELGLETTNPFFRKPPSPFRPRKLFVFVTEETPLDFKETFKERLRWTLNQFDDHHLSMGVG